MNFGVGDNDSILNSDRFYQCCHQSKRIAFEIHVVKVQLPLFQQIERKILMSESDSLSFKHQVTLGEKSRVCDQKTRVEQIQHMRFPIQRGVVRRQSVSLADPIQPCVSERAAVTLEHQRFVASDIV